MSPDPSSDADGRKKHRLGMRLQQSQSTAPTERSSSSGDYSEESGDAPAAGTENNNTEENDDANELRIIDSLLERRGPAPIAVAADEEDDERRRRGGGGGTAAAAASSSPSDVVTRAGPVLDQQPPGFIAPAAAAKAHEDVYGRPPHDVVLREERIAAVEEEMRHIPEELRRSLKKALAFYPLLYMSSAHAKLIIDDEDFEPRDAAWRLARYWERREAMFGKRAFSDGVFTQPKYEDYLRYYDKCLDIIKDPDADDEEKFLCSEYIRCVNETKIASMDDIIEDAPESDKAALLEARSVAPDVVNSDEHKLLFLRCEDFVEVVAAERMLRYWKAKKLFFGPDAFHRRIVLSDMPDHILEHEEEHYGVIRLMPEADAHGRAVIVIFVSELAKEGWTEECIARYFWYIAEAALDREECRKKGVVVIIDCRRDQETIESMENVSRLRRVGRTVMMECSPIKIRAMHMYYASDSWWRRVFVSTVSTFATLVQSRVVIHLGSAEENMAALRTKYGLSEDAMPTELGGSVTPQSWREWIMGRTDELS